MDMARLAGKARAQSWNGLYVFVSEERGSEDRMES